MVLQCMIDTNVTYVNNGKIQGMCETTCTDIYWNGQTKLMREFTCCNDYPNCTNAEVRYIQIMV